MEILWPARAPLSQLVFIFRVSDIPFCTVKQRSNNADTQLFHNQLFDPETRQGQGLSPASVSPAGATEQSATAAAAKEVGGWRTLDSHPLLAELLTHLNTASTGVGSYHCQFIVGFRRLNLRMRLSASEEGLDHARAKTTVPVKMNSSPTQ
jgi:hypothetical protein